MISRDDKIVSDIYAAAQGHWAQSSNAVMRALAPIVGTEPDQLPLGPTVNLSGREVTVVPSLPMALALMDAVARDYFVARLPEPLLFRWILDLMQPAPVCDRYLGSPWSLFQAVKVAANAPKLRFDRGTPEWERWFAYHLEQRSPAHVLRMVEADAVGYVEELSATPPEMRLQRPSALEAGERVH